MNIFRYLVLSARAPWSLGSIVVTLLLAGAASGQLVPEWLWSSPHEYDDPGDVEILSDGSVLVGTEGTLFHFSSNGDSINAYEVPAQGYFLEKAHGNRLIIGSSLTLAGSGFRIANIQSENILWYVFLQGGHGLLHGTLDGGYIGGGYVDNWLRDMIVHRVNNDGEIVWSYIHERAGNQTSVDAIQMKSSFCFSAAFDDYFRNVMTIKLNPDGTMLDEYLLPVGDEYDSGVFNLFEDPDGSIILDGLFGLVPDTSFSFVRLTPDGELLTFGGYGAFIGGPTDDGGFLTVSNFEGDDDLTLRRYDASFRFLWIDTYRHPASYDAPSYARLGFNVSEEGRIVVTDDYIWGESGAGYLYDVYAVQFAPVLTDLEIHLDAGDLQSVTAPGQFTFTGTLTNNTDADIVTDVWILARTPNGYATAPIRQFNDITVPAGGSIVRTLTQVVPASAPTGNYNYIVKVGDFPDPAVLDWFTFDVVSATPRSALPDGPHYLVPPPFPHPAMPSGSDPIE